jgi:hypothetical protein
MRLLKQLLAVVAVAFAGGQALTAGTSSRVAAAR